MNHVPLIAALALTLLSGDVTPQGLSTRRDVAPSEVLITTLPAAEITAAKTLEHDSEVGRNEAVTVVVIMPGCAKDPQGACNASTDIVVYTPDGKVHSETKQVSLNSGRGTTALTLAATSPTGVYRVVATVRDLNAKRFGTTERQFGVK
jgi:hypothetical protein